MKPECKAAIILPTLNEESCLAQCLNSIIAAGEDFIRAGIVEIVVIDNNSDDGTQKIARSFAQQYEHVHLIIERHKGVGYARKTGVRYAMTRSLNGSRSNFPTDALWIISTDADVIVPHTWVSDWLEEIETTDSYILGGGWRFPHDFSIRFPNSHQILEAVNERLDYAEELFGPINVEGSNSAFNTCAYAVIGPYDQPVTMDKKTLGRTINLPGEDWDMGTRARLLGFRPGRISRSPIVRSARRVEISPVSYFDGTAYEIEFMRVDADEGSPGDVPSTELERLTQVATVRNCVHFVEKPILVDESLLYQERVIQFLGSELTNEMKKWIKSEHKPDLFLNRSEFILSYLMYFHSEFGECLGERLHAAVGSFVAI